MTTRRHRPRIALLVNYLDRDYQQGLRAAIERAASRRGVDVLVVVGRELDHDDPHERALNQAFRWLSPDSVDGVIVLSACLSNFCGTAGLTRLCQGLAPVPTASIGLTLPGVPSIVLDNRRGMRRAVEHLARHHGRRKIAYIGGPEHNDEASERRKGYQDALEAEGVELSATRVEVGHFTTETGARAMREILERTRDLDAVVAANDYMAIGAMDELQRDGIDVPEDVLVMGFDDAPVARFAHRSLSTVAQPFDDMAERAVACVVGQASDVAERDGGSNDVIGMSVRVVHRESCGCGYVISDTAAPAVAGQQPAASYLRAHGDLVVRRVVEAGGASSGSRASFVPQLVDALTHELEGRRGVFLRTVERLAETASIRETSLEELKRTLLQLRSACAELNLVGPAELNLGEACMKALTLVSTAASRHEGRRALDVMDRAYRLRQVSQRLAMSLDVRSLADNLARIMPEMGVSATLLALKSDRDEALSPSLVQRGDGTTVLGGLPYPTSQLFPAAFPLATEPGSLLLFALTFRGEVLGLVAFGGDADPILCEAVRSQLSAALKLGELHARVVTETAMRERLASEQLVGEMAVARRIQTALLPRDLDVPGLEIAACMIPADRVGGDYYDVRAIDGGCWLAIGDVTGHGLLAGMIMLMLQTAVGTLLEVGGVDSPAELVCAVNGVIRRNVRERLLEEDHATFLLARYWRDGRLLMAGAHEDVLVYRAAERRCEAVATEGVWIGIMEDISEETVDVELRLTDGDLVVLYTDGLIEARNAEGEELGIDRVSEILSRHSADAVEAIQCLLVDRVRSWSPLLQDDVTLVVLRYRGASAASPSALA